MNEPEDDASDGSPEEVRRTRKICQMNLGMTTDTMTRRSIDVKGNYEID